MKVQLETQLAVWLCVSQFRILPRIDEHLVNHLRAPESPGRRTNHPRSVD
jgi:hypothetical protein